MASPAGGSRQAPLQKLNGRHEHAARLLAEGKSLGEVSREVGYGAAYWSRLRNESPLFRERIASYRLEVERAWRNSQIVHFNRLDDELTSQFWQKLARSKKHMSRTEALIRRAKLLLEASDNVLRPITAARRRRGEQAPMETRNTVQPELEAELAAVEAKLIAARRRPQPVARPSSPPQVQPQQQTPRFQDQAGLSGRIRRSW